MLISVIMPKPPGMAGGGTARSFGLIKKESREKSSSFPTASMANPVCIAARKMESVALGHPAASSSLLSRWRQVKVLRFKSVSSAAPSEVESSKISFLKGYKV